MTETIEVARDIAASPATVFAALTDITRMGEWSPETYACEWKDGATEAAVGAMWVGHNRNGDKEWTTEARITELVPNERFVFDCIVRDFVFSTWGYTIEPTEAGCYVTAGTKVTVLGGEDGPTVVKAATLSGADNVLFRRNSVSGAIEAGPRHGEGIALNAALHAN